MTETLNFTASDGLSLAYYTDDFTDPWKKAPTLLLLHAAMGSARRYFAWVPHLARDWRVVRLDMRGHGNSEGPPSDQPRTLDRLVLHFRGFLCPLGGSRTHHAGHLDGGFLWPGVGLELPAGG